MLTEDSERSAGKGKKNFSNIQGQNTDWGNCFHREEPDLGQRRVILCLERGSSTPLLYQILSVPRLHTPAAISPWLSRQSGPHSRLPAPCQTELALRETTDPTRGQLWWAPQPLQRHQGHPALASPKGRLLGDNSPPPARQLRLILVFTGHVTAPILLCRRGFLEGHTDNSFMKPLLCLP